MNRRFALSALTLLLTACGQIESAPHLSDRTIDLGTRLSAEVRVPLQGRWEISRVPDWLDVSGRSGTGDIALTVTAHRPNATPAAADQPQLRGVIEVSSTRPDGTVQSTARWTVTADQYRLSGRVTEAPAVGGQDLHLSQTPTPAPQREVRGLIVTYRSAANRDAVLPVRVSAQSTLSAEARQARATLDALGIAPAQRQPLSERSVVLSGLSDVAQAQARLAADPAVLSVTPNVVLHALATPAAPQTATPVVPDDQYAPLQWAFPLMGYGAVWRDMDAGGYTRPVTVAVADSGVRYDHPDLAGQLWTPQEGALDVLSGTDNGDGDGPDRDPTDPSFAGRKTESHGTHVTGIIVARWGQNAPSCAGCSPTGVVGASYKAPIKVLPIRVLDTQGNTDLADVINAVRYAAGLPVKLGEQVYTNPHPAQVLNLSLGGEGISTAEAQPMCDAVAQARERGTLTFAAAGNSGTGQPYYPAACPAAVAVGSVTLTAAGTPTHATYSNHYAQVQLSAPGGSSVLAPTYYAGGTFGGEPFPDDIVSTGWDYQKDEPNYVAMAGTSQATPQVAAVAALLLSKGVTQGPDDTLARLTATSTDLGAPGRDDFYGFGMVNAAAALGAPAVSNTLGVLLSDGQGHTYRPALNALGHFTAYLGEGDYRVLAGRDLDANGLFGEAHEPRSQAAQATLSPAQPQVELGELTVKP
ncbi:S8 family serine peptidase [Deinococcus radiodurans]|jgi:Subtilisin-like serine proteases|nr:S8 family serine peptidase [Deinococcus radiodurans]ANC71339.1 serine protease [Deinococcus radiodurans R1 = ATCC 13939 = DSM 20539]QIP29535.1 S8 family serine peptidase [Deinococcus radiodurans]QIP31777.1 S8 family serine peptidase [Deinococcus radiodurans]UID70513.1 serine protease [Deinococcus radiodurans R1 = ATCC 13939 = DSM 20539]